MAYSKPGGLADALSGAPPMEGEEDAEGDEDMGSGVDIAAADLIRAVKSGKVEDVASALRAAHLACQEEYGEAAPEPGPGMMTEDGLVPMANGGIVTKPTRALIGENGPEAVIPLSVGRTRMTSRYRPLDRPSFGHERPEELQRERKAVRPEMQRREELQRERKTVRPEELYRERPKKKEK